VPEHFTDDVFLGHSAKDKSVVRAVAERHRAEFVPAKRRGRHEHGGAPRRRVQPHPIIDDNQNALYVYSRT
jgi:hypothetical protein